MRQNCAVVNYMDREQGTQSFVVFLEGAFRFTLRDLSSALCWRTVSSGDI